MTLNISTADAVGGTIVSLFLNAISQKPELDSPGVEFLPFLCVLSRTKKIVERNKC